jgi:hypothetical protein
VLAIFLVLAVVLGACNGDTIGGSLPDAALGLADAADETTGPGCVGSPDASCPAHPDETLVCPGSTINCVSCGVGVYTLAPSWCTCVGGTWRCGPPTAQEVRCPTPVGQYVDPNCTVLYGADAGGDGG